MLFATRCTTSMTPEEGILTRRIGMKKSSNGERCEKSCTARSYGRTGSPSEAIDKPMSMASEHQTNFTERFSSPTALAWIAEIEEGERIGVRQSDTTDSAVLLAISQVPRWNEVTVDDDVSAEEFDEFIQRTLSQAGLDTLETVRLLSRESTLRWICMCSTASAHLPRSPLRQKVPVHQSARSSVTCEAFSSDSMPKSGPATRVTGLARTFHALVGSKDDRVVGHVDAVSLKAKAVIRVPCAILNAEIKPIIEPIDSVCAIDHLGTTCCG